MKMLIALDLDRLIGRSDGSLPWRLPGDLRRFRALTSEGSAKVIIGRVTWESMVARNVSLPGRAVLVALDGNLERLCRSHPSAWICGGAQIYRAALELGVVTEVYATRVYQHRPMPIHIAPQFSVFAPQWEQDFQLVSVELGADVNTCYEVWRRA